jgi:3-hydroxyacyl-CoA dehydrogenase/enoyl-CoA hydratase/3-hydroxybutyryl-CoA epimerase
VLGTPAPEDSQLAKLVAAGNLGKKTGRGFYEWVDGKPKKEAPVRSGEDDKSGFSETELDSLGKELIEPMINECEDCLEERVVEDADHVDAGVIFGTGFAPFRGGPLHYRASQNKDKPAGMQQEPPSTSASAAAE